MLELLQQILASNRKIKVGGDEVINNIDDQYETIVLLENVIMDIDGELQAENITVTDSLNTSLVEPPFQW